MTLMQADAIASWSSCALDAEQRLLVCADPARTSMKPQPRGLCSVHPCTSPNPQPLQPTGMRGRSGGGHIAAASALPLGQQEAIEHPKLFTDGAESAALSILDHPTSQPGLRPAIQLPAAGSSCRGSLCPDCAAQPSLPNLTTSKQSYTGYWLRYVC